MNEKIKNAAVIAVAVLIIFGFSLWSAIKPDSEFSESERRMLAAMPEVSVRNIFYEKGDNSFMMEFEKYAADQFPVREGFRRLNSAFSRYVLRQKEANDIYISGGYAAKLEYVQNDSSLDWAVGRFDDIAKRYLNGRKAYIAVVPDKGYYLAKEGGYPSLDYEKLFEKVRSGTEAYADYIDITGLLDIKSYYRTDAHWRQEKIVPVAEYIAGRMGADFEGEYETNTLEKPFYGVYYGQSALPMEPDTINYLTSDILERAAVRCLDGEEPEELPVYDMEKALGRDGYEIFLSGARALITIENPLSGSGRELVIFRDSFGSSLAPLLAGGYEKVTLVDIRYISPAFVGRFVDFEDADVLFLYSTSVLNNSEGQLLK